MASVDPYATCPCGSGQKYKFCCQKVEAYAERAQRLIDSEQYEAALKPLEEGLAKVPDNPWLLTRKAMSLPPSQPDGCRQAGLARFCCRRHPNSLERMGPDTQLVLETEGPVAGVAQFQQALSACQPENRGQLAPLASFVGTALAQAGFAAAAIKHLELAMRLGAGNDKQTMVALHNLRDKPGDLRLGKEPLSPRCYHPPMSPMNSASRSNRHQDGQTRGSGRPPPRRSSYCPQDRRPVWSRIAIVGCVVSGSPIMRAPSRRCGATSLGAGPTIDAIDLEALCQRIDHPPITDPVEFVQLAWPIRNRDGLLGGPASRQDHR